MFISILSAESEVEHRYTQVIEKNDECATDVHLMHLELGIILSDNSLPS